MKTTCHKPACSKPAVLEVAPLRYPDSWVPYCEQHLAEIVSEDELLIRRVGKKK